MSTTTLDLTSTVNRLLMLADRIESGELLVTTAPVPAPVVLEPRIIVPAPAIALPAMATAAPSAIESEPEPVVVPIAVLSSLPAPPAPPSATAPPAPPSALSVDRPFIPTPPTIIVPAPATRTNEIGPPDEDMTALATIEQLRATIDELSGRKLGPRSRRKLVDALAQEREVLHQLGCDSYLDLMLRKAAGSTQTSPLAPPASPSAGISIQTGWLGEDRGIDASFEADTGAASDGEIDAERDSVEAVDTIDVVPSPASDAAPATIDDAPPTLASFNWPAMAAPTVAPAEDPALANSGA